MGSDNEHKENVDKQIGSEHKMMIFSLYSLLYISYLNVVCLLLLIIFL